jgi:hypothetical protein
MVLGVIFHIDVKSLHFRIWAQALHVLVSCGILLILTTLLLGLRVIVGE